MMAQRMTEDAKEVLIVFFSHFLFVAWGVVTLQRKNEFLLIVYVIPFTEVCLLLAKSTRVCLWGRPTIVLPYNYYW